MKPKCLPLKQNKTLDHFAYNTHNHYHPQELEINKIKAIHITASLFYAQLKDVLELRIQDFFLRQL